MGIMVGDVKERLDKQNKIARKTIPHQARFISIYII